MAATSHPKLCPRYPIHPPSRPLTPRAFHGHDTIPCFPLPGPPTPQPLSQLHLSVKYELASGASIRCTAPAKKIDHRYIKEVLMAPPPPLADAPPPLRAEATAAAPLAIDCNNPFHPNATLTASAAPLLTSQRSGRKRSCHTRRTVIGRDRCNQPAVTAVHYRRPQ